MWTIDLWADPRWPRLGPAARTNKIRGVLAAPVIQGGRPVGTCNALTTSPRSWTHDDGNAIRAYAAMLGQLIGSASDARHKGELMGRHGLDDQAAFARLRRQARSSSRRLTDVAREIIGDRGR